MLPLPLVILVLALMACQVIAAALLLYREGQHRQRTEELASAILATLTADDPLPIDPAAGRVLDARDLTDEQLMAEVDQLMAEVRRRNGGLHEAEEQQ